MKKNMVLAIIIVLLALAVVFYSFDKKYPAYQTGDNLLLKNRNVITHTVEIRAFEFYPSKLIITIGEKVIWINKDNSPHTVTSSDKELNSAIIPPNETYYHIFEKEGDFVYNCSLHPFLSGKIDVNPERS